MMHLFGFAVDMVGRVGQYDFEWCEEDKRNVAGWQAGDSQIGVEIEAATTSS